MKIEIQQIEKTQPEQIIIQCYEVTHEINRLVRFVQSHTTQLEGFSEDKIVPINLNDIYYLEAVDNYVFAYTQKECYRLKYKLYEFEEAFRENYFFRCSKQTIINLMKIDSISPTLNRRFLAKLNNNETIIISRKYVSALREKLRGEAK